jgi:hypothetical protein
MTSRPHQRCRGIRRRLTVLAMLEHGIAEGSRSPQRRAFVRVVTGWVCVIMDCSALLVLLLDFFF